MCLARRLAASVLAAGLVLMAWSTCASGAMLSEMMCCAEGHGECEMAGMAESCCGPDRPADVGMLTHGPNDSPALTALTYHSAIASTPSIFGSGLLATSGAQSRGAFRGSRPRPHHGHTVLLI